MGVARKFKVWDKHKKRRADERRKLLKDVLRFQKSHGWGAGLHDVTLKGLEAYYENLLKIEDELKEKYGDLGSSYNTAGGELEQTKREVLKLITETKIKKVQPFNDERPRPKPTGPGQW